MEWFRRSLFGMDAAEAAAMTFIRAVAPSLQHINRWISTLGAAVALYDIQGNGLADDVCYVDTRTNLLICTGTGSISMLLAISPGTTATSSSLLNLRERQG